MAYSFSEHIGDGLITTFPFSFVGPDNGYFRDDSVYVEVDEVSVSFTLTGPTQVTLTTPPSSGSVVRIIRKTDDTEPYTDFQRGNAFGKTNINRSFQQQLYLMHRMMDGFKEDGYYEKQELNMGGHKIVNVGSGNDPDDLVTKDQLDLKIDVTKSDENDAAISDRIDSETATRIANDAALSSRITSNYNRILDEVNNRSDAIANIQAQLIGEVPLEASAFSPISWHDQTIDNSVIIPDNKNAWSFGPTMTISTGQTVTVGTNSYWTIANGEVV